MTSRRQIDNFCVENETRKDMRDMLENPSDKKGENYLLSKWAIITDVGKYSFVSI